MNRTITALEGSATLDGLIHDLIGATHELRHENEDLREHLASCRRELRVQAARCEAAEAEARIDSLTRLPNRRAFDERIAELQALYQRHQQPYSLVLLDLDRFKTLNDCHGHAAGDSVLAMVGRILRECCRASDHASRYGGEEFALLTPNCGEEDARVLAERCRLRIQAASLRFADQDLRVTTSGGVAEAVRGQTTRELLARADAALYSAKDGGRNSVCVSSRAAGQPVGSATSP